MGRMEEKEEILKRYVPPPLVKRSMTQSNYPHLKIQQCCEHLKCGQHIFEQLKDNDKVCANQGPGDV